MLHLLLIVKGDRLAAAQAAAARGIPFAFVRENRGETIGQVNEEHRLAVYAWFRERAPAGAGTVLPFPAGTLLHYVDA